KRGGPKLPNDQKKLPIPMKVSKRPMPARIRPSVRRNALLAKCFGSRLVSSFIVGLPRTHLSRMPDDNPGRRASQLISALSLFPSYSLLAASDSVRPLSGVGGGGSAPGPVGWSSRREDDRIFGGTGWEEAASRGSQAVQAGHSG